jgi:methyl-accepting chemotaxis protein
MSIKFPGFPSLGFSLSAGRDTMGKVNPLSSVGTTKGAPMDAVALLRRFSIRLRIRGAVGVVVLWLALIGAAGYGGIQRLQQVNQGLVGQVFQLQAQSADIRVALGQLQNLEKDMIISYDKPARVAELESQWKQSQARLKEVAQTLAQGDLAAVAEPAQQLTALLGDYSAQAQPVIDNLKSDIYDTAGVANKVLKRAHETLDKATAAVAAMDAALTTHAAHSQQAGQHAATQALWVLWGVMAVALGLMLPGAWLNTRSICDPIQSAQDVADSMAQGDLTRAIATSGHDEMAALMRAQQHMQAGIARIVTEVHKASDHIRGACAEIASGNMDLSHRTESAAASLEQTAASMRDLIQLVEQTTEVATRAAQTAQANARAAQEGGTVVGQVVATMQDIDRSSRQIADITGVIDSIAFQTNILALNAAVEAARAGESGRGFAVVASEVRVLAQRTATAAKEIKTLIQDSVGRISAGVQQVDVAGSTIAKVVEHAQEVAQLIASISQASGQQSQGIHEVNQAVAQLDTMTQQNAALVEQSAAASQSLLDQAESLTRTVSVFKT